MPASRLTQTETALRRAKAVELRKAGASLDEIAAALAYGGRTPESKRAAVSKDLSRAWQAAIKVQTVAVEEWRQMELERLDRLQRAVWPAATAGDTKAVHAALSIIAERRKYVPGVEAPTRVDARVTDTTHTDPEILGLINAAAATAAEAAAQLQPPPPGE